MVTVRPRRMMLTRSARASTSPRMWLDSSTVHAVLRAFADALLEGLLHQRVEPGGRLVEDEQLGLGGQRGDEGDLLPVALGVVADPLGRVEVEAFDQLGAAALVESAVRRAEDVEALPAGQPGPQRDVTGRRRRAARAARGLAPRVAAEQFDVAAVVAHQAEEDPDRGRLARAVGAEEPVHLARAHVEVEPVEGAEAARSVLMSPSMRMTASTRHGCSSLGGAGTRPR